MTTLARLYQDRELYTPSNTTFCPPSERRSHVVRFELTTGCNWGRCTYCDGYQDVSFDEKDIEDYREHVDTVFKRMDPCNRSDLRRVFIGGGNALGVETPKLHEAIQYAGSRFGHHVRMKPKRTSVYGRTDSINEQGRKGLRRLYNRSGEFGLDLIYWGVETGSDDVLAYVKKGCTHDDIVEAGREVREADVKTSVMIMPGLGGIRFYDQHVEATAEVLGAIRPEFLTFMGVNPGERTAYTKTMAREERKGKNRPLTDREMAEQMIAIIDSMPVWNVKVGCFPPDVDAVGHNPLTFNSYGMYDAYGKRELVIKLRRKVQRIE